MLAEGCPGADVLPLIQYPDGWAGTSPRATRPPRRSGQGLEVVDVLQDARHRRRCPRSRSTRRALLRLAGRQGALRVAALATADIEPARAAGLLADMDLLALNAHEAQALASAPARGPPNPFLDALRRALERAGAGTRAIVTAGRRGAGRARPGRQPRPRSKAPVASMAAPATPSSAARSPASPPVRPSSPRVPSPRRRDRPFRAPSTSASCRPPSPMLLQRLHWVSLARRLRARTACASGRPSASSSPEADGADAGNGSRRATAPAASREPPRAGACRVDTVLGDGHTARYCARRCACGYRSTSSSTTPALRSRHPYVRRGRHYRGRHNLVARLAGRAAARSPPTMSHARGPRARAVAV